MKSSVLFVCSIFFFILSSVSFAGDYRFSSKLNFEYEDGFFPGILDQYVLKEDASVRLLIGYFENRDFQTELCGLSDVEIKDQFAAKKRELDFSGIPENRKLSDYSVNREGAEIFIFLKYEIKSDKGASFEINSFRVREKEAIAATLYYDQNSTSDGSREFHRMMNRITFSDSQETAGLDDIKNSRNRDYRSVASLFVSEVLPEAHAADCNIVDKKYVLKGNYSTTPGSTIFNFKQLSMDVISAVQQNDPNSDCLATSMNSALTNASDYWAHRALAEGCLTSDGGVPESAPDGCPDASFREMKRSFAYIDKLKGDMRTSLDKICSSDASGVQCQPPSNRATMDAAAGVLAATANLNQPYCCDPGKNGHELGPLMKVLISDDKNFKNLSDAEKVKQCVGKTQGSLDKKMASLGGVSDCLYGVVSTLITSLYSMIKGMVSLFDWETVKFVANLVNIFNSDARNGAWGKVSGAVKELGQLIAAQIYSVTDCLGPYEKEQYICKMTGSVLGVLLAPATIKLLVKTIVSAVKLGGKATGLTSLLTAAAQKPPLKNTTAISQQSVQTLKLGYGRAKSAVTSTVGLKAIQQGARRVISILHTHITKPFAAIVAQNARRLLDTVTTSAKTGASKVNPAVSGAAEKVKTGLSVQNIAGEIPHAEAVVAPAVVRQASAPIVRGAPVSDAAVAKHKATIVEVENRQAQIIANGNPKELRESLSNLRTSQQALYRARAGAVDGSGNSEIKETLVKARKTELVLQNKVESLRDRRIDPKRTQQDRKTEYVGIRSRGAPGSVRGVDKTATVPTPAGLKPSLLETKNYVRETTDAIRSQNYINNAICLYGWLRFDQVTHS